MDYFTAAHSWVWHPNEERRFLDRPPSGLALDK